MVQNRGYLVATSAINPRFLSGVALQGKFQSLWPAGTVAPPRGGHLALSALSQKPTPSFSGEVSEPVRDVAGAIPGDGGGHSAAPGPLKSQ